MSAQVANNPPQPTESKSARKKKAKAEAAVDSSLAIVKERSGSPGSLDDVSGKGGSDGGFESAYVKEMQKQIRSVNKKLTLMQKVDSIIAANPSKSLDELVASKTINNDQKAQALKKPSLLAQRASLEDQIAQHKKVESEYQSLMSKERSLLKSSHAKEMQNLQDLVRKEVELVMEKNFKLRMLVVARFLKAAAERRQKAGGEEPSEEDKAFEGILYGIYTGDVAAVKCAEKLIDGVEEPIPLYDGVTNVTFARVKELMLEDNPIDDDSFTDTIPSEPTNGEADTGPAAQHTDPTIAYAGLTETEAQIPNGASYDAESSTPGAPHVGLIGEEGNAAAEEKWDGKAADEIGMDDSYEIVPRDPQETENRETQIPVASANTQSWADEASAAAEIGESSGVVQNGGAAPNGDGFSEVVHRPKASSDRGSSRGGRGGMWGGSRGDGHRGRGRGGDGRGRGRGNGGPRGGRGRGGRGESS